MKKLFLLIAIATIQFNAFAQSTWKNDKAHSKLAFTVTHLGVSDVSGVFKNFEATIIADKADFSDAQFDLSVETSSVNTDVEMRDNDLKSATFFDSEKIPGIVFKSISIKRVNKDHYQLSGNLTLHGVTKLVTMKLWYRGTITNPMSKAPDAGFQIIGVIKRSDFNFGAKYPAPFISDEVTIKADGEFAKAN